MTASEWRKWIVEQASYPIDDVIDDLAVCERERDEWKDLAEVSGFDINLRARAEKAEAEVKALREELADYLAYWDAVESPCDDERWLRIRLARERIDARIEARRKEE